MSLRAVMERDFFAYVQKERFFVTRGAVVGVPLAIMMLYALEFQSYEARRIGQLMLQSTILPMFAVLAAICPSFFAPVLADERRARKLDVLRSSPISMYAVVFGRYAARLLIVLCMWLAFLPLPALSLIWGGVAIAHYVGAVLLGLAMIVWTSAASMLVSSMTKDMVLANRWAYGSVAGWILLTWLIERAAPIILSAGEAKRILAVAAAVNPFIAFDRLIGGSGPRFGAVASLTPVFAHLLFAVATAAALIPLAGRLMTRADGIRSAASAADGRFDAVGDFGEKAEESAELYSSLRGRAAKLGEVLWSEPAIWLEWFGARRGRGRTAATFVVVGLVLSAEAVWFLVFSNGANVRATIGATNLTHLHLGAIQAIVCLGAIHVAVSGNAVLRRETDQSFREVLFSTPLTNTRLVTAQTLTVLWSARWWWALIAAHVAFAVHRGDMTGMAAAHVVISAPIVHLVIATDAVAKGLRAKKLTMALLLMFVIWGGAAVFFGALLRIIAVAGSPLLAANAVVLFGAFPWEMPLLTVDDRLPAFALWVRYAATWGWWLAYGLFAWRRLRFVLPALYQHRREDKIDYQAPRNFERYGGRFKLLR